MSSLGELATLVRSKNAGPFWLTLDVFLPDEETFELVSKSLVTDPVTIGELYRVDPDQVKVFALADLRAIKISFPRPVVQGSLRDSDMHGGQQYVPLLTVEIEGGYDREMRPLNS
jgi:hypothetical protein